MQNEQEGWHGMMMMMMRFKLVCPYARIIIVTLAIMFFNVLIIMQSEAGQCIKHNYKYSRYTTKSVLQSYFILLMVRSLCSSIQVIIQQLVLGGKNEC